MTCPETRLALGAYVLGALDGAERRDVERHLLACPQCAAELSELETLPALLATVGLPDVLALDAPRPLGTAAGGDLPRAACAHGSTRRSAGGHRGRVRSRRRVLLAGAVLVLGVVAGGGAVAWVRGDHGTSTYQASAGSAHMSVAVAAHTAQLTVWVGGLPGAEHCTLVAVSRAGARRPAGSWTATYAGHARFTTSSPFAPADLAQLVLLGTEGQQLVVVDTT